MEKTALVTGAGCRRRRLLIPDYDGSYFRYYVFLHDSSAE